MFLNIKKYSLLFMVLNYHKSHNGIFSTDSLGSSAASDCTSFFIRKDMSQIRKCSMSKFFWCM